MRMHNLLGGSSVYAHLAGLVPARGPAAARPSARRAEDDEEDKDARADGDPDQYPDKDDSKPSGKGKRSRAEDDEDDKDARAEDDDKDKDASDGDDDEDDKPAARRARARAEDDEDDKEASEEDDDEKEEMSGKSAVAAARRRERARCKAIFSHPAAAANLALAASLAFDTTQTRKEALAVLKGQGAAGPAHGVRADRRARNPDLGSGGDTAPSGAAAQASSWDRALNKAGVAPVKK